MPADQAEIKRVEPVAAVEASCKTGLTAAPRKIDGQGYQPCALSTLSLQLSRDHADKPNSRSSELTSLLLEIPPAKLIRLLPLVETGEYQGREPHPIKPWLCRLTRPKSSDSELTSCCR